MKFTIYSVGAIGCACTGPPLNSSTANWLLPGHRHERTRKLLTKNENPDSIEQMKTKTIGLTLTFCFLGWAACLAADPQMGTWKLNEAKSKMTLGTTKNTLVVYEAAGDQVKVTVNGVNATGKSTHNQWTGRFDGKNYP